MRFAQVLRGVSFSTIGAPLGDVFDARSGCLMAKRTRFQRLGDWLYGWYAVLYEIATGRSPKER